MFIKVHKWIGYLDQNNFDRTKTKNKYFYGLDLSIMSAKNCTLKYLLINIEQINS